MPETSLIQQLADARLGERMTLEFCSMLVDRARDAEQQRDFWMKLWIQSEHEATLLSASVLEDELAAMGVTDEPDTEEIP